MYNRLLAFLNKFKFFNNFQHGFRKSKSTTTALVNFVDGVLNALDGQESVCGLFLDLSKAFDTLNHTCLLMKLERIGIRGASLNWFASYLENRKQKVRMYIDMNKYESDVLNFNYGVPQGSVLGPLLFIIFLNDLVNVVRDESKISIVNYADDTNLTIRGKTFAESQQTAIQTWENLKDWFSANQLILNESKSTCVIFNTHKAPIETPDCLTSEIPIPTSNSTRLLGVVMDSKCKWVDHIENVLRKLNKSCYALRILSRTFNADTLKTVYYANFYSTIKYGIEIWGGSTDAYKIHIVQKRAIRIIFKKKFNESCRGCFKENAMLTVPGIYIYSCLMYLKTNKIDFKSSQFSHYYETRNKENTYTIPKHRLTLTEKGPYYAAIKFFNLLPSSLKDNFHCNSFKKQAFGYICDIEPYSIQEFLNFKL